MKTIGLMLAMSLVSLLASADPPPQIATATQRYEAALKQAELAYSRTLVGIKHTYIQDLLRSRAAATKSGDLTAATAIDEIRKGIEAELKDLPLLTGSVTHVRVSGSVGWQDGVALKKGDRVKITAAGSWCLDTHKRSSLTFGPAGDSQGVLNNFVQGAPSGALLGQLGSAMSVIGAGTEFTAQQSGMLRLRVNDSDSRLFNNDGAVDVTITVGGE